MGFLGRGFKSHHPYNKLYQTFPMSNLKNTLPGIPTGNETAWILTDPPVYPADLLFRRFRGEECSEGYSLGKLLVNCQGFSGILVRLTTCKRFTDSIPKLSLTTIFPPETAGYQVGQTYRRTCQYIQAVSFPGYTGESIFQIRLGENLKSSL